MNSMVEPQRENCKMKRKRDILFIFFFIIFDVVGDSTIFLKFSQGEPSVSVITETARFVVGNCRAEVAYPRLEPNLNSVKKLNLILKKTFLDSKFLFEGVDCNSRFRRSDPAYFTETGFLVSLNSGDYISILSTTTGFLAKARTTDIKKKGLNFRISNAYPLFLDSILRPESGYRIGLEDIFIQKLTEAGHIEKAEDFGRLRKKNYEFLLKETEIEFFFGEGGKSIRIAYGELDKYLNRDLIQEP